MLMGKYNHSLDSKGRLIVPSKLKDQLGDTITIIKDAGGCLCMYSKEEWENYTSRLNDIPKNEARGLVRFLYANASELQPDAQGRILLSQEMIKYAGINKNIVTVGCGKYAEIWAEEKLEQLDILSEPENFEEALRALGM